jgi:hypothetical protein
MAAMCLCAVICACLIMQTQFVFILITHTVCLNRPSAVVPNAHPPRVEVLYDWVPSAHRRHVCIVFGVPDRCCRSGKKVDSTYRSGMLVVELIYIRLLTSARSAPILRDRICGGVPVDQFLGMPAQLLSSGGTNPFGTNYQANSHKLVGEQIIGQY